ncbi:MAG: hypothetical protein AB7J40_05085 [Candidatus Altimarinota bacterium]
MEKSNSENTRPALIRIGPNGTIDGLRASGNLLAGDIDLVMNEGVLKGVELKDNKHILPQPLVLEKVWYKKPEVVITIILGVISIPWWDNLLQVFGVIN